MYVCMDRESYAAKERMMEQMLNGKISEMSELANTFNAMQEEYRYVCM